MANKTFVFILFVVLFSCQQAKEQKTVQKINLHFLKDLDLNSQIDSIRQDLALQNALAIAKTAFHLNSFEKNMI